VQWDDLLTFPVKYRDLASNAKLVLTLWGLDKRPVGGTAMDFFDENGVLRTGRQKLTFYPFRAGDWGVEHNATPAAAYDECASEDLAFQIEKARESYDFNQVG
jgi:phosphatidylinositol 3-kinase